MFYKRIFKFENNSHGLQRNKRQNIKPRAVAQYLLLANVTLWASFFILQEMKSLDTSRLSFHLIGCKLLLTLSSLQTFRKAGLGPVRACTAPVIASSLKRVGACPFQWLFRLKKAVRSGYICKQEKRDRTSEGRGQVQCLWSMNSCGGNGEHYSIYKLYSGLYNISKLLI